MKRILFIVFFIASTYFAQETAFFSTKEDVIIDPHGNPILLKGINVGNWLVPEGYFIKFGDISSPSRIYNFFNFLLSPSEIKEFWNKYRENYITYQDIKKIKALGFNSIRIPFHYQMFINESNNDKLEGIGYKLMDDVIDWCKKENLYVLLDMHCAPGGQTGDNIDDSFGYPYLFEDRAEQIKTILIWKKLAEIYSDEPIIIGYDLLNEPIAHYFDKDKLNPKLEPFFIELTKEIRQVDKNHLIFIAGAQWNSNFSIFGKPFDDKLVYTFHKYWTPPTIDVIKDYIDFSKKYKVPIYLGESGENTNEWINDFRIVLEQNNIGWCFWPYKKMDSESCVLSITKTAEFDSIIAFANSKILNYNDIRTKKPNETIIKKALNDYLDNMLTDKCSLNEKYIQALGLKQ